MALQLICNFALILGKRTQERVQKFDNDESNSFFSACAGPEIVSRRWGWGSVLGIFEFAMGRGERFRGIFFSQFYQFKKLYFFKAGVLTPSHTPSRSAHTLYRVFTLFGSVDRIPSPIRPLRIVERPGTIKLCMAIGIYLKRKRKVHLICHPVIISLLPYQNCNLIPLKSIKFTQNYHMNQLQGIWCKCRRYFSMQFLDVGDNIALASKTAYLFDFCVT